MFAKAVAKDVQDGDLVWVHDYHLMLLPQMLREEIGRSKSNVKVGFFLHTPFPSSEIYRILPVRDEILLGLLDCDLIGFHTYDYARHFLSSCSRILGLTTTPNGVEYDGKVVTVGAFPIGIDPDKFTEGLKKEKVKKRIAALEQKFQGVKLIVGVDRLDYIKGVPQKMHALEVFLTDHPEWIGKVVLVQVAVPSRQDVEEYQNLRAVVNELVGRINGKFGECKALQDDSAWLTRRRHDRVHAYPLDASVRQLRRAHCSVRHVRRVSGVVHEGWHEPGLVRVHRHATKSTRGADLVRIHGRRPEPEREHHSESLEHRRACRGITRSGHHERRAASDQLQQAGQIRVQVHQVRWPPLTPEILLTRRFSP